MFRHGEGPEDRQDQVWVRTQGGQAHGWRHRYPEEHREGQVTMKEQEETGNSFRPNVGKTLEARTLRVPAGWNKPASRCGRFLCREVAKTWGRGAARVEACLSRRTMGALKGTKPGEAPVLSHR